MPATNLEELLSAARAVIAARNSALEATLEADRLQSPRAKSRALNAQGELDDAMNALSEVLECYRV